MEASECLHIIWANLWSYPQKKSLFWDRLSTQKKLTFPRVNTGRFPHTEPVSRNIFLIFINPGFFLNSFALLASIPLCSNESITLQMEVVLVFIFLDSNVIACSSSELSGVVLLTILLCSSTFFYYINLNSLLSKQNVLGTAACLPVEASPGNSTAHFCMFFSSQGGPL